MIYSFLFPYVLLSTMVLIIKSLLRKKYFKKGLQNKLTAVILGILVLVIFIKTLNKEVSEDSWKADQYIFSIADRFTIKTNGCKIPALNPYDDSIKNFIKKTNKRNVCNLTRFTILENNATHIWIKDKVTYYALPKHINLYCCYRSFYRPSSIHNNLSRHPKVDDRVEYGDCIEFVNFIEAKDEFVKVSCYGNNKLIHEQFFLFALKQSFTSIKEESGKSALIENAYNVIVLGLDAISRLNFYRTMPKTQSYLKKKGAVELYGYNKVGDNTFPNLIPILLGMKDADLKSTCWPDVKVTFDYCPFIWDWFKDAGYYTAYGEDSARLSTFNYKKQGFDRTPTDYYLRTFIHEAESHYKDKKDFYSSVCMGNKYFFQVLLDYIAHLATTLKSSKLFGFFWEVTMSHDFLNYPILMDDKYEIFLKNLDNSGYLNNTILLMLSDHGIRWGDIRFTKQGRMEERLPLMQILLPLSFRTKYTSAYENLKINSLRLTTPFDVYASLCDLVNVNNVRNENINLRSSTYYSNDRSISLFLPIPSNRTCKIAGIDNHWCTCLEEKKLPTNGLKAKDAACFLVSHLNNLLIKHKKCAHLTLKEVIDAAEKIEEATGESEEDWRKYLIVIKTSPGDAVFEATLNNNNQNWSVTGSVSRLNLYGEQSFCMQNYLLQLYCYCQ